MRRGTIGANSMKRDDSKGMTPPAGPGNTNSSNPQAGSGGGPHAPAFGLPRRMEQVS